MYIFAYFCRLMLFVLKTNIEIVFYLLFLVVPCGYCGDKKDLMAARLVKTNENKELS
jgi:hypothetical protein